MEVLAIVGKILMVILFYGALFWLTVNPVLEYFEVKEVTYGQSAALFATIVVIVLFIKEL